MSAKPRPDPVVEDEDDLDDLDDVISKFTPSSSKPKPNAPPAAASAPKPPLPIPETPSGSEFDDDFTKELAQGMESLMRELSGVGVAPGSGSEDGGELTEKQKAEFKAAWEAMLVESLDEAADPETLSGTKEQDKGKKADKDKDKDKAPPQDFQSLLRSAMDNIHESESNIKKEGEGAGPDDDSPAALLQQILALTEKDLGTQDSNDIADMLQNMMDTIISKEVLHEPITELKTKFPPYLQENSAKLSKEDKERYNAQLVCINEIHGIFEDPKYNDSNPTSRSKVAVLMEKLQTYGAPPSELMGPLPGLGEDMPEGCTIA